MMGYLRCFLSLRASISGILSRRFNTETNQYQLQCFGFAAILVYQIPRCTDWAIIVQFGFSKMAVCWLLPFNLLGGDECMGRPPPQTLGGPSPLSPQVSASGYRGRTIGTSCPASCTLISTVPNILRLRL